MTVDGTADQPTPAARPAPPPPPGTGAGDGGAKKKHHPEGNFKDTIESILVAFILAFVFRAFVVEAFVIPTGSMAPTLLGAHTRFTCADCGYAYTVNYSTNSEGNDIQIPGKVPGGMSERVFCPNCGYPVPPVAKDEPDRADVPVHYGDRILVLKYRYLLAGPRRWDVVVFKTPDTVRGATPYTTNYIKRLVGLPGETVMLLDGDVYVSPAPPIDHAVLVNGLRSIVQDPTTPPGSGPDAAAARDYLATFRIQRKPGYAQDAVWRNVYDNDFVPHLPAARRTDDYQKPAAPWAQPWKPAAGGAGWDVGQNLPAGQEGRTRRFAFANGTGGGGLAFDPGANERTFALTDFLAYDQIAKGTPPLNPVLDLRLGVTYERQSGDGPFRMSLAKGDDRFTLEVTPGKARLIRQRASFAAPGGWEARTSQDADVPELAGTRPVRLQLQNVDRRVSVRVDGREVLSTDAGYDPTPAELCQLVADEYHRTGRRDRRGDARNRPVVEVSAERQQCALTHVKIDRDVFYINTWNQYESPRLGESADRGTPDLPVTLGPAEYFTLGDNSPISGDARRWPSGVELPGEDLYVEAGRVPGRFLLGKAFFVYWPAGHRPYSDNAWGLVPNFGEMRVIQ